ncbi:MAG TPA: hypothetical protein VMS17_32615 [Gemmataceae bacterium]|nr:hypothetical protein [Gemmataceae bacterium]
MLSLVPLCASISERRLSRTHYQVLGVSTDEQDPRTIEEAALSRSAHVRAYQLTRELESTLQLNEIARALITLLDPILRREYDQGLGKPPSPAAPERPPPHRQDTPVLPRGKSAPPTPGEGALPLLISDEGACDVKLMYREVTCARPAPGPAGRAGAARRTAEKMLTMFHSIPSPALKGA